MTEGRTLGYDAIDFSEDILGIKLYPWQRFLLIHSLELRPEGGFRFRKVVLLVARQQGKSTLCQILSLFFLYMLGTELVLGTAQDLDTAEEVWEGALEIIEDTPELAELMDKPIKAAGKKAIRLKTGERYKIKAANRRAGRGLSGDLVLLDELREHQNWESWAAITNTTNARDNAQIWALSNAGDATSIVLRHLRKAAHLALGDPDGINSDGLMATGPEDPDGPDAVETDDTLGIFEWSAPPGCDMSDRAAWVQANPSLGYGGVTERTLASAAATDPEWVFRTEVLCCWSEGSLEGPFPPGTWEAGTDAESKIAADSDRALCVDVSHDRSMAYVAIAGYREDGNPHVEIIAQRAGTSWVPDWFTDKPERKDYGPIALQAKGAPVSSLLEDLQAVEGLQVVEWMGSALGSGTGAFYDGVRCEPSKNEAGVVAIPKRIYHRPQPVLDISAATAVPKYLGEAIVWNRAKSPTDAAPLVAATGAVWLLGQKPEPPAVSAYEAHGVTTI